ncbi:hypothetical protein GCM10012289_07790 [Nonomuraea cavernae]|uniref:Uncharacterized protein n=2 Tax=Nonomuraea cavernae TaxID=2045107 RepID=A0A917YPT5_9ACTN|nr:hypothetical protein GCM10012289_07790 [Nonomuraea cavernae]
MAVALTNHRLKTRQELREQLIDGFIESLKGDTVAALAGTKLQAARIGDRELLRKYYEADNVYEVVDAMHSILLKAMNAERAAQNLQPLELCDIDHLVLSPESARQQQAWRKSPSTFKVDPALRIRTDRAKDQGELHGQAPKIAAKRGTARS